jgi:hypothetical protein
MNKYISFPSFLIAFGILLIPVTRAQDRGLKCIDIQDLESHLSILASDDMEGRKTGDAGLDSAAMYLAGQAREIGLSTVDEDGDYFQDYTLVTKKADFSASHITVRHEGGPERRMENPFYLMNPDSGITELNGEAVFAGYGIYSDGDGYNDFEGIDLAGKIVIVMNRGPLDESGDTNLLNGRNWKNHRSFRHKMPGIVMRRPKAVLIVMDPKSGYRSMNEYSPGMARYFSDSRYVKELGERSSEIPEIATKLLFIHREVAEEIIRPSGSSLAGLQDSIDCQLRPVSFELPETRIEIHAEFSLTEKAVPNVVGLIEGTDPERKDEVIVYSAHFDHLGMAENGEVYNGADDNASGTAALLEIAEAFMAVREELKRSVMILWVSGEEIGLYGSNYYSEYPLIPLEQTIANLNLDMVGAVRTERDRGRIYGERVSVLGMDSIGLIGGHQSTELMDIHIQVSSELGLHTDLSLNDPDHPYRYYYRSDHYNFAKHDIPVLFYSTGIHVDYHKVTDNYDRIHFPKLKKVSELSYLVGYELATMPERIIVDNPFSGWNQSGR